MEVAGVEPASRIFQLDISTGVDCLIFSESSLGAIEKRNFRFFCNFHPERRILRVKAQWLTPVSLYWTLSGRCCLGKSESRI
ncbi:MAG: hypothetical protein UV99_C0016G0003 [Parcubacteria group bacterium GW2011_GWC1_43_61]|nr:MAG: hypothetical protein UU33_C0001G0273 [Candidatus Azambacteria bacterium GW2011_GWF1_41_10]KKS49307.1 MAG: hypothetical protein UV14_C0001G0053 [Candidatus Azambacteria bacterium GW2011_GWF2_42_22]KKS69304.1 MAG: hypothetical protein UV39_C0014G0004 [Candidatus Azambacteria bacterium GW2011_GWA2_42_62]KKT03418.1 MAG: hypothetical protein UV81_C0001G0014 [Candidatus Azambacteria bacterium GW2011_GWD1_43_18]KKT12446.1 MAG: hypothetical protein UV93_C0003G0008 [Candidatus Azambacteria bacte